MEPAIQFDDVTKRYGDTLALDGLTLAVERETVYGLLGPNGAGKTTAIDTLLDLTRPTAGSVTVLGADPQTNPVRVRSYTGVLPERFEVLDRLTAREHVSLAAEVRGAPTDASESLSRVGLSEAAHRRAKGFSHGMKRRLGLAMALAGDPEVLVLDEPSRGLDPNGIRRLREIVLEEAERGTTVLFSSHLLAQVDAVCDEVAIVDDGRTVADGPVDELVAATGGDATLSVTTASSVSDETVRAVESVDAVSEVIQSGPSMVVELDDASRQSAVLATLERQGVDVRDFESESATLEDVYSRHAETRDA